MISITEMTKELERVTDALNNKYFEGQLPDLLVTIQSYSKNVCTGWFYPEKWIDEEGNKYHEINIVAEFLNRNIPEIITTLQHQLIHVYCYENGITDVSRKNRYHNVRFKEEAEKRGLVCKKDTELGFIFTGRSKDFEDYVLTLDIQEVFKLQRKEGNVPPPTI